MTKQQILDLLVSVKRSGIDNLIKYLEDSTYFSDPLSTDFQGNYEGGLSIYSLKLCNTFLDYIKVYPELEKYQDSIKIISLLHGLGRVGIYQKAPKNVLARTPSGDIQLDPETGKQIWKNLIVYEANYKKGLPYPTSIYTSILIKSYIKLTSAEDLAIIWQNGMEEYSTNLSAVGKRAQDSHLLISLFQALKVEARKLL